MVKLDWKVAELIGAIIGDGYLHLTENRIVITGSLEDQFYYKFRLIPLFKSVFHKEPKISFRKNQNACDLVLENKGVFDILVNKIGLVRGNKTHATVPSDLLKNIRLMKAFLRGLFDTDGSLKFSKQNKEINYYPRIRIALKDSQITEVLELILNSLKFNFSKTHDNRFSSFILCYEISGMKMLDKWVNEIGFGNMVHASKYLFWKKFGFHKIKSNLEERLNSLKLSQKYLTVNCSKL